MKNLFLFVSIIFLFAFTSCSLQKRLYNKGFYTHKTKTVKASESIAKTDTVQDLKVKIAEAKPKNTDSKLVASNSNNIELNSKPIEGCDTIILKNGAKILASITEINLTKILFRNCNSADETVIFIKKSDVSYINFANGSKQVFDTENNNHIPQNLPGERNLNQNITPTAHGRRSNNYDKPTSGKLNPFSLISFIMSIAPYPFIIILFALFALISLSSGGTNIFALIFGSPHMSVALVLPFVFVAAAIIMSIVAIYQIKNSGAENQKGLKLAYIALALSLILLLLLLLIAF